MAYKAKPIPVKMKYNDEVDAENYLAHKVHQDDDIWTGLYDADGRGIYKTMDQIGFIRRNYGK